MDDGGFMALPDALLDRLRRVKLLAIDVDGVLTDGRLYFQADGIEIKAFHPGRSWPEVTQACRHPCGADYRP